MANEINKETEPSHVESDGVDSGKKPTFRQKAKRHCARFWWIHVIVFIILVLVIVLPVIYVGYPNLAQKEINKSTLEVTALSLTNPAPDSFDLELTTVLHTDSKYHPNLDAFNGSLQLQDSDVPFAYLNIPAMEAGDGVESQVSQRVQIANLTEYTKYVATTLGTEEYSIFLKGKGGLKQGGLPNTNVDYNKEIKMKGLNKLEGFNVTDFNILTTPQEDGSNANGTLFIPNPTVMTVQLGTVTLSMSVDGSEVGSATIQDMTLAPGDNRLEMRAVTNQTAVLGFIFNQYKDGVLPIDVVGNTTTFNGQTIPYYQIPLQHNVLRLNLDVIDALERAGLADLLGINRTTKA